jgi:hypothetical protein
MTLDRFLASHTSRQLTEIVARDRLDPYDHIGRIELGFAKLECHLLNRWRDPNRCETISLSECLPTWGAAFREQADTDRIEQQLDAETPEQAASRMKATFAAMRSRRR